MDSSKGDLDVVLKRVEKVLHTRVDGLDGGGKDERWSRYVAMFWAKERVRRR